MKEKKNDLFDYEKNAYISRCSTDLIVYSENGREGKKINLSSSMKLSKKNKEKNPDTK